MIRHAAVLLLSLAVASSAQADPAVRAKVEGVAAAVEARYFDEAKAARIAGGLRREAAAGAYDALTDDQDLAVALTRKLKPSDQHFAVTVDASTAPDQSAAASGPQMAAEARARRGGYGFRRAEVLPGNVGYIDLRSFDHFTPDAPQARAAADAALAMVAGTDAVIVDLRDNGGGSPAMVGYLVSAFTPKDADIYNTFHGRGGRQSEAPRGAYPTPRLETPLYVLISGRTGSAAESFAYTLQAAKRATVVGEASAGGANPGGRVSAGRGLSVFVSQGTPINPITKTNWEGTGVAPDLRAPAAEALMIAHKAALAEVLRRGLPPAEAVDAQWALAAYEAAPEVDLRGLAGEYSGLTVTAEKDRLSMQRGRRPAMRLKPLARDLFVQDGEPSRRVAFVRGAGGEVVALELRTSDGSVQRYRRG